jgi:hypothetical protein
MSYSGKRNPPERWATRPPGGSKAIFAEHGFDLDTSSDGGYCCVTKRVRYYQGSNRHGC